MHTEKNALDNIAVSECVFISLFSIPPLLWLGI